MKITWSGVWLTYVAIFLEEIIFLRWFLRFIPENMAMWFHLPYLWEGVQSLCYLYNSSLIVLVCQICLYKPCTTGNRPCACVIQAHKACMACTCKRRYLRSLYGLVLVLVLVYNRYRRSPWSWYYFDETHPGSIKELERSNGDDLVFALLCP